MAFYRCSILAYETAILLQEYNCSLYDLSKSPFRLDHDRVVAFASTLDSLDHLYSLHDTEIHTITSGIVTLLAAKAKKAQAITGVERKKIERKARHRIYAALLALGVQRQMKRYLAEYT